MNPPASHDDALLRECYRRSVELLKKNSAPSGVIACARSEKAVGRHYASIFGRDAAICAMGMVASGDGSLIRNARTSLLTLARFQAPNGQIPKYVKPELQEVDFWYYGCIDATLWWLIAVNFHDRHAGGSPLARKLGKEIDLALHWLRCQEHQGLYLLQQNEASDWADIMPRSGFVLYSNALWYHVKWLYGLPNVRKTRHFFKYLFYPFNKPVEEHRRARVLSHFVRKKTRPGDFYLSFVNFSFWGPEIDVFGNILAGLLGLTTLSRATRLAERFIALGISRPWPVRVVHAPIRRNSRLWRPYMERHRQNFPYQYHNGGIWPFVGGFWVLLLAKTGKHDLALQELHRLAEVNRENDWEFNEWFHGKTGAAGGMGGQSWNAALFILAWHALADGLRL